MGGIDEDVRAAFLGLSKYKLQDFFFHYEKRYGSGARVYAEKAFLKWQVGATRMSAQTTERLLQVLPPFLGTIVKYELLRKLRERHRLPERHSLEVTTTNYKSLVGPLVQRIIGRAYSNNLPADLEQRLSWLCHDDTQAAGSLLAGAEALAMEAVLSRLDEEFIQMERLLAAQPKGKIIHVIELPYGIVTLSVRKGNPMEDEKKSSELATARTIDSTAITTSDQLLKHAIRNLTPEQMNEVSKKATDEAVNLQVEAIRADRRFDDASRQMDAFLTETERIARVDVNFKKEASFNTASGTTSIKVERNSSKLWIIVAAALAVLVLLLVMKR